MTDDIPFLFFAQSEHKSGRFWKNRYELYNQPQSFYSYSELIFHVHTYDLGTYIVHFEPYFIL